MAPLSKSDLDDATMVDDTASSSNNNSNSSMDIDDGLCQYASSSFSTGATERFTSRSPSFPTRSILKKRRNNRSPYHHFQKTVHFSPFSQQILIPNLDNWTPQEIRDSFLSGDEFARIKQDSRYTISAMNQGIFPDNEQETFRGLESGMDDYYVERKHMISTTVLSILRVQQKFHWVDPHWVEEVYCPYTARSMVFAVRAGEFDAQVAASNASSTTTSE
jgi:hypothetical protein